MLPDTLAFVDVETTGTSARFGRIIEIGVVRVEDNEVVQTYHSLINPQTHLPPEIEMMTGITQADLENQPTFREIKRDILEILADATFVAHNARFDYSFLKHEFMRENINFSCRHFCTVRLSRALFPTFLHHNLDAIIERFGFTCENRHRAFDDAKILWEFYQKAQKQFAEDIFLQAVNIALQRPNIPIKLTQEDLDNLPEQPGVYIFYGKQNPSPSPLPRGEGNKIKNSNEISSPEGEDKGEGSIPLYIGKSINIKDRVLSHFSGDLRSGTEMNIAQQVESIETIVTAGELGALFLESKLIKEKLPLYNRMLRNKRKLVTLKKKINKEGYETVEIEQLQSHKATKPQSNNTSEALKLCNFETSLGFFKSRKQAKEFLANIAKEFGLCEKLLGLEKTMDACFAYRLGRCKGACTKQEKPLFYNLRFTTAFYKTKIKPWPFNGPIVITEKNELTGETEYFVIDKWCYLGCIKTDREDNEDSALQDNYLFDLDMYKILVRFLNKPQNLRTIREVQKKELFLSSNYLIRNIHSL